MCDLTQIKNNREAILIGEIGALLHDIGKCHPDFVSKNSIEKISDKFRHADIDKFLKYDLVCSIRSEKFKIKIIDNGTDIYSLITKHHPENSSKLPKLVKFMISCDRLDSADDKGIVRKKQSVNNTIISSPFGYPKERIDLQCLEKSFNDLQNNLLGLFSNYIEGKLSLTCTRECLIINLSTAFSHALGETRIPANDVTLWDHSHSTASLFKSVLCELVLGEKPEPQKLQWRLFGFCWDGIGFINKGKKIADILKRNEIIEKIKSELKKKFEDDIPIGNVIYAGANEVYFTFPTLNDDKARKLAKECAKEGLEIIRKESDDEIWPFFTLSKPSRTLMILTSELKFAAKKMNFPKISPMLFIEEKEEQIDYDPDMPIPKNGADLCPICKIRTKSVNDEECNICKERRKGRLYSWLKNWENTIWIDEVADKNNRIAILTLKFDLDKWLDGTMIGTIYSQTFDDWVNDKKWKQIQCINVEANKKSVYEVIDKILDLKDSDNEKASKLLNTFFEESIGLNTNSLNRHISNIKERIGTDRLTKESLATYLFSQNPSPARLYRCWRETEDFFGLVIREIKEKIYPQKWERIKFSIKEIKSKLSVALENIENIPLIIKIDGLEPESLLVLHTSNGQFWTIESLEKFRFKGKFGVDAIKEALKGEFYWLAEEDEPDKNLLFNKDNMVENIKQEYYYPFIEVTRSPLSLRLIIPAEDAINILNLVVRLYNQRFENVIGKLPLKAGLLVVKRKFPLYVLLDASERLFHEEEFSDLEKMDPWWDIDRINKYYSFYPTKITSEQKYTLDDLEQLSKGKQYLLYPGYFDFDLLLGTDDRYRITYEGKRRADEYYKLYSKRPYYLYQISEIIDLWEILKNNLSGSQINFIEESLISKLREWRNVEDKDKERIFKIFAEATSKNAFGDKWGCLRKEIQDFVLNCTFNGLLLDTIVLFNHIIKEKEGVKKDG